MIIMQLDLETYRPINIEFVLPAKPMQVEPARTIAAERRKVATWP